MLLTHMVRHVLLGAVAPPIIWLGVSLLPPPRWLSCRSVAGQLVTNPIVSWLAATLTVIGWHVPAAFELAQRSELWHGVEDASFLVSGLLFWWPVIQPWPAAARLSRPAVSLYLFAATLPCDALSAFLVFCDRVVYREPLAGHGHADMSALADQQAGGAFMWVSVTFIYLIPALVMMVRALSPRADLQVGQAGAGLKAWTAPVENRNIYEFPIRIPVRKTSTPPSTT